MNKIKKVFAQEIKDSRGKPTLEVLLKTEKGDFSAKVPSGASKGKNEALELRDEDGGVNKAIMNVNTKISPLLEGKNCENQKELDDLLRALDGTNNKSNLGANSIVGVSMAICRAGAASLKLELYQYIAQLMGYKIEKNLNFPLPMFNILNGGSHANNNLSVQEFMVVPQKEDFSENLKIGSKIFSNLKEILIKNYGENLVMGDEGGFAPPLSKTEQALFLLNNAINNEAAKISLDCAASHFFKKGKYLIDQQELSRSELLNFYCDIANKFPLLSLEDPFDEDDWEGFKNIKQVLGNKLIIIGDDLTTTNIERIKEAYSRQACNGVIIKLNQIGTVSETLEAIKIARSFNWKIVVSHRSGETMDDFISDLAVGAKADFIKAGSPFQPERRVKYQRILDIKFKIS